MARNSIVRTISNQEARDDLKRLQHLFDALLLFLEHKPWYRRFKVEHFAAFVDRASRARGEKE